MNCTSLGPGSGRSSSWTSLESRRSTSAGLHPVQMCPNLLTRRLLRVSTSSSPGGIHLIPCQPLKSLLHSWWRCSPGTETPLWVTSIGRVTSPPRVTRRQLPAPQSQRWWTLTSTRQTSGGRTPGWPPGAGDWSLFQIGIVFKRKFKVIIKEVFKSLSETDSQIKPHCSDVRYKVSFWRMNGEEKSKPWALKGLKVVVYFYFSKT